jgi:hypothetical protein
MVYDYYYYYIMIVIILLLMIQTINISLFLNLNSGPGCGAGTHTSHLFTANSVNSNVVMSPSFVKRAFSILDFGDLSIFDNRMWMHSAVGGND